MRHSRNADPHEFLPLSPADFQLLMVLLDRDLHAYGITDAVEEQGKGRVRLEIGSLYRMLARMEEQGLIAERSPDREATGNEAKRKYYRITSLGKSVARAEAARLRDVMEVVVENKLLPQPRGR